MRKGRPSVQRAAREETSGLTQRSRGSLETGALPVFLNRWAGWRWLLGLLIVAGTNFAYRPAWNGEFIWDDSVHIRDNPALVRPDGLRQIWFSSDALQYYPLVFTSFRLERALWGLDSTGYHWVNLLLHSASALLVWRVLRRLMVPGAWLTAAIFAVHPVNVESVAWISQRKNTLAMFFYLLSLLMYVRSEGASGEKPESESLPSTEARLYWASLIAFAFALLSKTAVAPLPIVLLGLAWWRRGRITRRDVWRSLPFFMASLVMGLITMWFEHHMTAPYGVVRDDSLWSRLACAGWAVWFYLIKAVAPLDLTPVYPHWEVDATKVWVWVPILLMVILLLICWCYRRSWGRNGLAGLGYFVVMLLPVLGFVNIGYMRVSLVADHWQYFAILGPLAALGGLLAASVRRGAVWGVAGGCLLLVFLGCLTWRHSAIFQDPKTFWRAALEARPGSWDARKDWAAVAHGDIGTDLLQKGHVPEALVEFQTALQMKPDFAPAQINIGNILMESGNVDEAIVWFEKAARARPDSAAPRFNLANGLRRKGRLAEAISHYHAAVALDPGYAEAYLNLGITLAQDGQRAEAVNQFQKALELRSADPKTLENLALLLATAPEPSLRDGRRAMALAERANELSGGVNPLALHTLAAALAETGRFEEARQSVQKAIELAAGVGRQDLVARFSDELRSYQAGLPLRQ